MNVRDRKRAFEAEYGRWTAYNIHLGDGVYTMDDATGIRGDDRRCQRFVQVAADLTGKALGELRVLDLACLEGQFAIEFALQGATAVGIEGRALNVARCQFAKDALGLSSVEFHQDDVRNLSREKYGSFDVVICSGILYHLDPAGVFLLLERIAEVCTRLAIVDTQVSLSGTASYVHAGETYFGHHVGEHGPTASTEERLASAWASLDNTTSFWLTRPSLQNALASAGFTTVADCVVPSIVGLPMDRVSFAAIRGTRVELATAPGLRGDVRFPESATSAVHPAQRGYKLLNTAKALVDRLPGVVGRTIRSI